MQANDSSMKKSLSPVGTNEHLFGTNSINMNTTSFGKTDNKSQILRTGTQIMNNLTSNPSPNRVMGQKLNDFADQ
jgi:hypothetical protein